MYSDPALTREQIENFARLVSERLGAGFSERVYHTALEYHLKSQGIPFETERVLLVPYMDVVVGTVRADLVVRNHLIVELKSVPRIRDEHISQCRMYMRLMGINEGLVINFATDGTLEFRAVGREFVHVRLDDIPTV